MDYQLISAPLDKAEYLFFAGSCKHRSIFYKLAVAEQIEVFEAGYTGHYLVLLQSERGTFQFTMHKNDEQKWQSNDQAIHQELVFLIGSQIDTIKA